MPAFSYAQAAKGLAPSVSQSSIKDVKEEPLDQSLTNKPNNKSDSQPQSNAKVPKTAVRSEEKEGKRPAKEHSTTSSRDELQDKENLPPARRSHKPSISANDAQKPIDGPDPTKDNQTLSSSEQWETSGANEKESVASDKDKSKDNDDDWEKVSIPSVAAEKELKAAPIPTVNIWQQRIAAEAKRREQAAQKTATPAPASLNSSTSNKQPVDDAKRKSAHERDASTTSRPTAKPTERADFSSTQSSRPGSRGEKRESTAVVGDGTSWPTPDTASVEKKSVPADRSEKPEGRTGAKSKNWVQMPFVPTAKFETQLPPSAAKRGGRNARGGRDGSGRGGHLAGNGDRNENAGAMGPPAPKQTGDSDRGRKADANRGGRASSLPAGNQRALSHETGLTNPRKPSAPAAKESIPAQAPTAAPFVPAAEAVVTSNTGSQDVSRSSSRQNAPSAGSGKAGESSAGQNVDSVTDSSIQAQVPEGIARPPQGGDRSKPPHSNYRSNEYTRTERNGAPRNRERSDNAREKVESWRDREYSGEGLPRRERGSERGRGSYRGRGGHTYPANYAGGHPYTAPLPQNGFDLPKSGSGEPRPRQSSQPFSPTNHPPSGRNPNRAQSIPLQMMYPGHGYYGNSPGMPQSLAPLQTDMQAYGLPQQMPMQQGIMSAMPYNDQLGSYAVLSMVMSQMEYYFSIDNLCKDLYLRKNMDSQGWVLLSVVANFKRIKQLAGDDQPLETLRMVCGHVKNLEYMQSPDGEERVRRREGWKDFVLPMNDRLPSAQNDGPAIQPEYMPYQDLPHGSGEAMPFIPAQMRSPQSGLDPMNGMFNGPTSPPMFGAVPPYDGHAGGERQMPFGQPFEDSRRESITSPFSPNSAQRKPLSALPNGSNAPAMNGHHRSVSRSFTEESTFPDDQINLIHIYKREVSEADSTDDKTSMPQVERALSNDSQGSASRFGELRGGVSGRKPSDQYVPISLHECPLMLFQTCLSPTGFDFRFFWQPCPGDSFHKGWPAIASPPAGSTWSLLPALSHRSCRGSPG